MMIRSLWLVGFVITGMSPGLVPAQPPDATTPLAPTGQHCVASVEPVQPGAQDSKVTEGGCFATLAEALAEATDGAVRLDPQTQPHELTEEMFPTTAGRTIIAIDFDKPNFADRNNSKTWYSNHGRCTPNVQFRVPYVGREWNDRVSSVLGAGNCRHQFLYEHIKYNVGKPKGRVAHCRPSCKGFRVMNNKASSRIMAYE